MISKICLHDNTKTSNTGDVVTRQPLAPPPPSNISEESATVGSIATKTEAAESSHLASTHTIDPMTFSLRPLPRGGSPQPTKCTYPVVGDNQASATPTSEGTTPTSAFQQANVNSIKEDDLIAFSITPAMLGRVGSRAVNPSGYESGHQLEPVLFPEGQEGEDLIEFSLTPALLSKFKSSAVYSSGARSRLMDDQKRSHSLASSISPSHSPSLSPSSQLPRSYQTSHSTQHQSPHSIPINSSSQNQAFPQFHSDAKKTPPRSIFHTATTDNSKFVPNWEHFSEPTLNKSPVAVAPQKLLPPQNHVPKVGVVKPGGHDGGSPGSIISKDDGGNGWTVVTKMDPSSREFKDVSPAVLQLKRVASQPGFTDEGMTLVPMEMGLGAGEGRFDLAVSRVSSEYVVEEVRDLPSASTSSPTIATSRHRFDPLPTPAGLVKQQPTLDYADLDLAYPGYERVAERNEGVAMHKYRPRAKSSASSADYAEIRFQSPGLETRMGMRENGNVSAVDNDAKYSRLVDVTTDVRKMERNSAMPLGHDPNYAVPHRVALKLQRDQLMQGGAVKGVSHSTSHQSQAENLRDRPRPSGVMVADGGTSYSSQAGTIGDSLSGTYVRSSIVEIRFIVFYFPP